MTLYITDNKGNNVMNMKIINGFINFLGEINLSTREGSEVLESTTNIMYDRFEIKKVSI
jgi:hypothetical protein